MAIAIITGGSRGLGRSAALQCAARGLGVILTYNSRPCTDLGGGLNDEFESLLAGRTTLGRVGEPDDIGRVIVSLLSDDSTWINAQTIEVADGYVI